MGQPVLPRRSSEEKSEKMTKESTTVICTGEKASKPGSKNSRNYCILMCLYFNGKKNSLGDWLYLK